MSPQNALLQALPTAVYTTDADGRITFFNDAAAELWGRQPELGDKWCGSMRLFTIDGRPLPHDQCPMAEALRERRPITGREAVLERPSGERIPFLPHPTPLFDDDGNLTGAINMLTDLRTRHQVEADSARLAAIVSSSDDAIISKTLDGRVTSWNAGAQRIFGYDAKEMIGEPIIRLITPELQSEERDIIARLTRGERIEHYETVRLAKDGRRIDVSLTVSPLRDSAGRVVGASKVARDVTDRKRAEAVRRLLLDELNHRIKNTLANVQAIAGQTLRHAATPSEFVTSFNGRIQALGRAHGLLTSGSFQGAEMGELVRDQLLLGGPDDRRITYSGPSLVLDAQTALHIALVLHELGANARKHGALSAPAGAVSIRWDVHAKGGRQLVLNWRESDGPRVSVPTSHGFGAALIEHSLEAHGGQAEMSYAACGVTCVIHLPLPVLDATLYGTPLKAPARAPPLKDEPALAGKRVLMIEDEALIAMLLSDYLEEAGCTVIGPAQTVDKALAAIKATEFDAALVDGNLSGQKVDAIALALTQKRVPFCFVTGYGREALPEAYRDALVVEKPFTQEQVIGALESLLTHAGNVVSLKHR